MAYNYNITLQSIKLKNKKYSQVFVTNRKNALHLVSKYVEDCYIFDETFNFIQGREQKQYIQLLVSYLSDSGDISVVGDILIDRFKLVPSQEVLQIKLRKCIDDKATCKLVVNSIQSVQYVSPRKRFDSFNIPKDKLTPLTFKSGKSSIYDKTSHGGKSQLSRINSPKSVILFSSQDEQKEKLKRELAQYKILLESQKQRVRELLEEVKILEEQRDEERQLRLKMEFSEQQWEAEKISLLNKLKHCEKQNQISQQVYLRQVQNLKQLLLALKPEASKNEEKMPNFLLDLGKKTVSEVVVSNHPPFYQDAWKKKKRSLSTSTDEPQEHIKLQVRSPDHKSKLTQVFQFEPNSQPI